MKRKTLHIYATTHGEAGVKTEIMMYNESLQLWPLLQTRTQTSGANCFFSYFSVYVAPGQHSQGQSWTSRDVYPSTPPSLCIDQHWP